MLVFPHYTDFERRSKIIKGLPPYKICKCGSRLFSCYIQDSYTLTGKRIRGSPYPFTSPNKRTPITQVGYFCINCGFIPMATRIPTKDK